MNCGMAHVNRSPHPASSRSYKGSPTDLANSWRLVDGGPLHVVDPQAEAIFAGETMIPPLIWKRVING